MQAMSQPSFDLDMGDAAEPTYTVRELADALNQVLRRGFRDGVWVRGEIEGFQTRGGHVYFTLTERTDEGRASLPVALFANTAYRLRPVLARHRLRLGDGLSVRIHGAPNVYSPTGRLSLVMDGIDVRFTLGQLAADRDALLARLTEAGLVGRNAALRLPLVPVRIGLVASRGSAAWHDVLHELEGSGIGFRIAHVDVRVQGQDAAAAVAGAIRTLARRPLDVIVVVRGRLPHRPGHVRRRTHRAGHRPVRRPGVHRPRTRGRPQRRRPRGPHRPQDAHRCAAALVDRVRQYEAAVANVGSRIASRTGMAVRLAEQRIDHASARLRRESATNLTAATVRMARTGERLAHRPPAALRQAEQSLDAVAARVRVLDPASVLARGWSITRRLDGSLVRGAAIGPRRRRADHHLGRRHRHEPSGGGQDMSSDDADLDDIGYGEALAELEDILAELEHEAVDVDHLAERVQRAAVLIRLCRGRIASARLEIETVVADLERVTHRRSARTGVSRPVDPPA